MRLEEKQGRSVNKGQRATGPTDADPPASIPLGGD